MLFSFIFMDGLSYWKQRFFLLVGLKLELT